jgi:hypothetical protein
VEDENGLSCTAREPNATTETRSDGDLACRNCRAAASASSSFPPAIERERSIAITTLLAEPRLTALRPTTARPFSVSDGGTEAVTGATTVTRIVG